MFGGFSNFILFSVQYLLPYPNLSILLMTYNSFLMPLFSEISSYSENDELLYSSSSSSVSGGSAGA